jgi:hypothetical protein
MPRGRRGTRRAPDTERAPEPMPEFSLESEPGPEPGSSAVQPTPTAWDSSAAPLPAITTAWVQYTGEWREIFMTIPGTRNLMCFRHGVPIELPIEQAEKLIKLNGFSACPPPGGE